MKVLVTGAKGQLGSDIVAELNKRHIECMGIDIQELDITKKEDVIRFFDEHDFDRVIHCAAWTQVDKAEDDEYKDLVYKINVEGTRNLAENCKRKDIPIMYFSTDYVFGGEGDKPYNVDDKKNPLGVYADTKYKGELAIIENVSKFFIIRISWVFGDNGVNFIKTMLKLSETHDKLTVVADQIGSPTYTIDLSVLVADMIVTEKYAVYHATNEGYVSWADFAREIFKEASKKVEVVDVTTEEYGAKANRPKNSRLDKSTLDKAGFKRLPSWQDATKRFIEKLER
ncbi:MAG: dTDP-4-dehydrorhamnose reductase [Lachnospiraceae bacterium]|nr:dTDP-4-dehydrorhamnose reductase [Lachnospiraceae bacterium]